MIGYSLYGRGDTRAIVLHGWFGDWTVFEPMLPSIDEERLTLAFVDYRGYGKSKAIDGPFDMATIASDAVGLADHLGWERFHLIGHSMGGKAALRVAVDHPNRVDRIKAVTPVWAGKVPFDEATAAVFKGAIDEPALREAILRDTTGGRLPQAWSRHVAAHSLSTSTRRAFGSYLESWTGEDFAAEARGLPHPTLVVVGAHDRGVTVDATKATWLASLPNATLQVVGEAGHYPMLETPPQMAALFESFLTGQSA